MRGNFLLFIGAAFQFLSIRLSYSSAQSRHTKRNDMAYLFRTTALGAFARLITGNKVMAFPSEKHKYCTGNNAIFAENEGNEQPWIPVTW